MKTIHVGASKSYDVKVGSGLLQSLGQEISAIYRPKIVAIISDSNVWPIYGKAATESLENSGFSVINYVFPAGEQSKNSQVYFEILNFLASSHVTRTDCLVALGGGVVGDITGFAAATYLRGVAYVQVPTTLLAAVDSSVGGKTAIDLPAGKNLVGAFYQPHLVLCDTDTLNTLPADIFRDGCAEVIKYGILYDETLFSQLEADLLHFDQESVIARCVELKRDVVQTDEFDTGARMKLNLGHTIGHGVEAQSNFTISHGCAVAIGTAIVARAGVANGICSEETAHRIVSLLKNYGLPTLTDCSAETLYFSALSDKKRSGSTIRLIVPVKIGQCNIIPTPIEEVKTFIQAGL